MGIVPQNAEVDSDVDSFIRYAKRQGGKRILLIYGRDHTLTLRPGVTSPMDTLILRNMSRKTFSKISADLANEEIEVLTGEGWVPGESGTPKQT